MIKPRMADGSRISFGVITTRRKVDVFLDADGDLWLETDDEGEYISPGDAIRALVESGQLPLWDAAARLKEAWEAYSPMSDAQSLLHRQFVNAVDHLCRVIDEMKEPTL